MSTPISIFHNIYTKAPLRCGCRAISRCIRFPVLRAILLPHRRLARTRADSAGHSFVTPPSGPHLSRFCGPFFRHTAIWPALWLILWAILLPHRRLARTRADSVGHFSATPPSGPHSSRFCGPFFCHSAVWPALGLILRAILLPHRRLARTRADSAGHSFATLPSGPHSS